MTDSKQNTSSVLIVDDHPIVRQGYHMLIDNEPDLSVCGEAYDFDSALQAIQDSKPDVALIDISLKGSNGLDLIKLIRKTYDLPILVISIHDENLYAERALRTGANGYIMKHEATEKVLSAIREVLSGKMYLSDQVGTDILQKIVTGKSTNPTNPLSNLSNREFEVYQFIGQGLSTKEIAQNLELSVKTVESHRAHIKKKLVLKTSNELVKHAVEWAQSQKNK